MLDGGNEFECECGQFEHMELLCSHVLKVLDFIRSKETSAKHIIKRWTKDARDILPVDLPANGATSEALAADEAIRPAMSADGQICEEDVVVNQRRESSP